MGRSKYVRVAARSRPFKQLAPQGKLSSMTETGKDFLLLVYSFVTLNSFRRER